MLQVLISLHLEGVNVQLCLSFLPQGLTWVQRRDTQVPSLLQKQAKSQGFRPSPRRLCSGLWHRFLAG